MGTDQELLEQKARLLNLISMRLNEIDGAMVNIIERAEHFEIALMSIMNMVERFSKGWPAKRPRNE